jgi:hypothetical protein
MKVQILSIALILFCSVDLFPQKVGDAYRIDINYINMPLNRKGILADVNIPPGGSGGKFAGINFLFSGGFFLSGYSNGQLWANAVASAALVEDYMRGTYTGGSNDPNAVLYKLTSSDIPFGQSWQDWSDAVTLGADFYDGDGDGFYNPVDLNGNNQWDPTEDHPDLLGDEMLWCVYQDALPSGQRRWDTVEPQGIEIRQSIFAYSSSPHLQNTILIRYRILNTGMVADKMTDVYFGVWDDTDLGDAADDLVGCDTVLQGSYTYNEGADILYGNNPPSFFVKNLAGPVTYIPGVTFVDNNSNGTYDEGIDTPLDTAYVHRGQLLGITEYPGAKNQTFSSAINYFSADPNTGSPDNKEQARNYTLGLTRFGDIIDPCSWPYGQVFGGVNCSEVNPLYWYSGDPVADYGWTNIESGDQRHLANVGPFTLEEGNEIEIVVAYVVGRGNDPLNSITVTKDLAVNSQILYDINFDVNNLPVEITSFTAVSESGEVTLNWATSTENNNLGFEIERKIIPSDQEGRWVPIGFVEGAGTTTEIMYYTYVDDVFGLNSNSLVYRLKQIDFNGTYEYSDEVFIDNLAPSTYQLYQNYPNPFNPSTTITYGVPVKSNVVLKVFDLIGNEIATLVNEEKPAGEYEVEFSVRQNSILSLSSGIYFYRLQAGSFVETKKMMLMK